MSLLLGIPHVVLLLSIVHSALRVPPTRVTFLQADVTRGLFQ